MTPTTKPIVLFFGCAMCGDRIHNESGYCPTCGDYSDNVYTDDAGNEYEAIEVKEMIDNGLAVVG